LLTVEELYKQKITSMLPGARLRSTKIKVLRHVNSLHHWWGTVCRMALHMEALHHKDNNRMSTPIDQVREEH